LTSFVLDDDVENVAPVQIIEDERERIGGFKDFVRIHFTPEQVTIHSRDTEFLEYVTKNIPRGPPAPRDIDEIFSMSDMDLVNLGRTGTVEAVPGVEAEEGEDPSGDPLLQHALVDQHGNVLQWFQHQGDLIKHLGSGTASVPAVLNQTVEKSRILFGDSFFLNRYAPYKDLIVPSGPESSPFDATVNMINCIIGPGMLCLPLAFAWSGYVLSFILLIFLGIVNGFTADLLVKCCVQTKLTTYNELAEKAYGRKMSIFVDLLIVVFGYGSMIAYMVALGDFGCSFLDAFGYNCNRSLVLYVFSLFTVFPLCMLQSLNAFKFASFVSLFFTITFMVVVVVVSCISMYEHCPPPSFLPSPQLSESGVPLVLTPPSNRSSGAQTSFGHCALEPTLIHVNLLSCPSLSS